MSIRTLLFGHREPKPDAIADQLQSAADEHNNAVERFAGLMRNLVDENRRIREHQDDTSHEVPTYGPSDIKAADAVLGAYRK